MLLTERSGALNKSFSFLCLENNGIPVVVGLVLKSGIPAATDIPAPDR
jgi:hypothetical protein